MLDTLHSSRDNFCLSWETDMASTVQPKIIHAQDVAQEVLAPQEHTSGEKKLRLFLTIALRILSALNLRRYLACPRARAY